jgi:hypothetical protein
LVPGTITKKKQGHALIRLRSSSQLLRLQGLVRDNKIPTHDNYPVKYPAEPRCGDSTVAACKLLTLRRVPRDAARPTHTVGWAGITLGD